MLWGLVWGLGVPTTSEEFDGFRNAGLPGQGPDIASVPAVQNDFGVALYTDDGNLRKLTDIEADVICHAVSLYGGRMSEVARRLRIGRSTLYRKLSELGIDGTAR